jgi:16S rRNA (guanine527-N7)-methyltransferase
VPDLLAIHRAALEQARTETNLVGPGPLDTHYLDAERGLADLAPVGHWADLGSGAGFPGVVLAAMFPELRVDLVEPRRLRAEFLRRVVTAAGQEGRIQVVARRVQSLPSGYDGACARALAAPAAVLDLAAPILRPGGRLVLFLQADQTVPVDPRFEREGEIAYQVPGHPPRRTLRLLRVAAPAGDRRARAR